MYPDGLPGLALLLLRLSTSVSVVVSVGGTPPDGSKWYLLGLIPVAAALCAGFFTAPVSVLAVAVLSLRFTAPGLNPVWVSITIMNTVALSILGAGAYSFDALRFGRRRLTLGQDD